MTKYLIYSKSDPSPSTKWVEKRRMPSLLFIFCQLNAHLNTEQWTLLLTVTNKDKKKQPMSYQHMGFVTDKVLNI